MKKMFTYANRGIVLELEALKKLKYTQKIRV